uniref:Uncharacterized protein n=2 Tax=Anguilla anguilla TaxID=7936 RepID=A0A0E9R210_ANGAN
MRLDRSGVGRPMILAAARAIVKSFSCESVSLLKKLMAPYTGNSSVTLQSRKRRRRCGF